MLSPLYAAGNVIIAFSYQLLADISPKLDIFTAPENTSVLDSGFYRGEEQFLCIRN